MHDCRGEGTSVAIVGANHPHANLYLKTLQRIDSVREVIVFDPDKRLLEAFKGYNYSKLKQTTSDLQDILDKPSLQAAIVTMPNSEIPLYTRILLENRRHVLIEKPGGTAAKYIRPLIPLAQAKGRVLSISYPLRFHPVAQAVAAFIAQGVLGRITSFEARWIASQVKFRDTSLWLFKRNIAGGGIFAWLGCHWVDLLRYWFADEIVEIAGMTSKSCDEPIDVEDTACAVCRFRHGALGTIRTGYHLSISKEGYFRVPYDSYLSVSGTDGRITWIPHGEQSNRLFVESSSPRWKGDAKQEIIYDVEKVDGYNGFAGWRFMSAFIDSVVSFSTPPTTGLDAFNTMKVIDSFYRSVTSSRSVTVP